MADILFHSKTRLYLKTENFWEPKIKGFHGVDAPSYCFLISHGNHHVLFDLGIRPDWQNYAPKIAAAIKAMTTVKPGSDVASILDSDKSGLNIRSKDIEAIIWSHDHMDHLGDPSTFPPTTELVVGPGLRSSWPGWPRNADAGVLDSDIEGRHVREISFDEDGNASLKIGRFDAFDYFGDGSFYLLDAPGHSIGHMCGLARTTADPPSFVFMGADACHHAGVLRPSEYLPLPRSITLSPSPENMQHGAKIDAGTYPGAALQHLTLEKNPSSAFFTVAHSQLFLDWDAAMDTVGKIQEIDAADNIFVVLAHDLSLSDQVPFFPETINAWKAKNLREKTRWLFCSDFQSAVHGKDLGNE